MQERVVQPQPQAHIKIAHQMKSCPLNVQQMLLQDLPLPPLCHHSIKIFLVYQIFHQIKINLTQIQIHHHHPLLHLVLHLHHLHQIVHFSFFLSFFLPFPFFDSNVILSFFSAEDPTDQPPPPPPPSQS